MKDLPELVVNVSSYILTATQTENVLRIVSLVASIIGSLVILASKILSWYAKAKADGKITAEEVGELGNTIGSEAKDLKENADEIVEICKHEGGEN